MQNSYVDLNHCSNRKKHKISRRVERKYRIMSSIPREQLNATVVGQKRKACAIQDEEQSRDVSPSLPLKKRANKLCVSSNEGAHFKCSKEDKSDLVQDFADAPFFHYKDRSCDVDDDPLTPLTQIGGVPNFPTKMQAILARKDLSDIIAWLPHGRAWKILKPREFEVKVLPFYFDHSKFSSFIRQANGWGFRRLTRGKDKNCYYNELFLRGLPHLCKRMRRPGVSEKIPLRPEHEPDLNAISLLYPIPDDAVAGDDDSILLQFTVSEGPKARMPVNGGNFTEMAAMMRSIPFACSSMSLDEEPHSSIASTANSEETQTEATSSNYHRMEVEFQPRPDHVIKADVLEMGWATPLPPVQANVPYQTGRLDSPSFAILLQLAKLTARREMDGNYSSLPSSALFEYIQRQQHADAVAILQNVAAVAAARGQSERERISREQSERERIAAHSAPAATLQNIHDIMRFFAGKGSNIFPWINGV